MEELENILNNKDDLNEDQLKKYLLGEGSVEDIHAVERGMADSEFIDDAVEGLQAFSSDSKLNDYVNQINKNLGIQLQDRKSKKDKRKIKNLSWGIIAVIVILLITVICFLVIKMLKDRDVQKSAAEKHVYYKPSGSEDPGAIS